MRARLLLSDCIYPVAVRQRGNMVAIPRSFVLSSVLLLSVTLALSDTSPAEAEWARKMPFSTPFTPGVNAQAALESVSYGNSADEPARQRPLSPLKRTLKRAITKALTSGSCPGCKLKETEVDMIVREEVKRVDDHLGWNTGFDFDAGKSNPFFPHAYYDQGILVAGDGRRVLTTKRFKSNAFLEFELYGEKDGACLQKTPSCLPEALKELSAAQTQLQQLVARDEGRAYNARLAARRSIELQADLKRVETGLRRSAFTRSVPRFVEQHVDLEHGTTSSTGITGITAPKINDPLSDAELVNKMQAISAMKEMAKDDAKHLAAAAFIRDAKNTLKKEEQVKQAAALEKKEVEEKAMDVLGKAVTDMNEREKGVVLGKVEGIDRPASIRSEFHTIEASHEVEHEIRKTLYTLRYHRAKQAKQVCLDSFKEKLKERVSMRAERESRQDTCMISGFANVRTFQNFHFRVKGEGTVHLNDNKLFSIVGKFEALDDSTVGMTSLAIIIDGQTTSAQMDENGFLVILDNCQRSLPSGTNSSSANIAVLKSGNAWTLNHRYFSLRISPFQKLLPSLRRGCRRCQMYLHVGIAADLPDRTRSDGLCGKNVKFGRASDHWYFGGEKELIEKQLRRFVAPKFKWCGGTSGVFDPIPPVEVASCFIVGGSHATTFSGHKYNLYHAAPEPTEYLLFNHPNTSEVFHATTFPISKGSIVTGLSGISVQSKEGVGEKISIEGRDGEGILQVDCGDAWMANGTTPGGIKITGNPQRWEIETVSGTKLIVQMWGNKSPHMNVYLVARVPHNGQASGLCGKFAKLDDKDHAYIGPVNEGSWGLTSDVSYTEATGLMMASKDSSFCHQHPPLAVELSLTPLTAPRVGCEFGGPGTVTTFGKYKYHVRSSGAYLGMQHPNVLDSVYILFSAIRDTSETFVDEQPGGEVKIVKAVAIKFGEEGTLTVARRGGHFYTRSNCGYESIVKSGTTSQIIGGSMLVLEEGRLTITSSSGTTVVIYPGLDRAENVFISGKIPNDGKARGMCGPYGPNLITDDLMLFGPLKSLIGSQDTILKYHDVRGFRDGRPFCVDGGDKVSFFEGSVITRRHIMLTNNILPSAASRSRVSMRNLTCPMIAHEQSRAECEKDTRALKRNSEEYNDLVSLYNDSGAARTRQIQEDRLLLTENKKITDVVSKTFCASLHSDIAQTSCTVDMSTSEGNIRRQEVMREVAKLINSEMTHVRSIRKHMRTRPMVGKDVGKAGPSVPKLATHKCATYDDPGVKLICKQTAQFFIANQLRDSSVVLIETANVHFNDFEEIVQIFRENCQKRMKRHPPFAITVSYSIDDGDTFKDTLVSVPIEDLSTRWSRFSVMMPIGTRTLPSLRVSFQQQASFCPCCDQWSIRHARMVPRRKLAIACKEKIDSEASRASCQNEATFQFHTDPSTEQVYFQTDAMPDSQVLRFEFSFAQALYKNRCGANFYLATTSYENRSNSEQERVLNGTYDTIVSELLSVNRNTMEIPTLSRTKAWQIDILVSQDNGVTWRHAGVTPPAEGATSFYEFPVPLLDFKEEDSILQNDDSKLDTRTEHLRYRFVQNTSACECCDDLFVRYAIPA